LNISYIHRPGERLVSTDVGDTQITRNSDSRITRKFPFGRSQIRKIRSCQPHRRCAHSWCFWLFVLSAVAYLDRTNISVAAVQLAREFGIDRIHLGWVFSAFLLGYDGISGAGRLACCPLRAAQRRWVSDFCGGACSAFAPRWSPRRLGHVLLQLILVRFVLGWVKPLCIRRPISSSPFGFRKRDRAKANGWLFAGVGAGAAVTPPWLPRSC